MNQITPNRARLLTALAAGRTLPEATRTVGIPFESARSEMKRLREITGEASLRVPRAWWVLNSAAWAALMAEYAEVAGLQPALRGWRGESSSLRALISPFAVDDFTPACSAAFA